MSSYIYKDKLLVHTEQNNTGQVVAMSGCSCTVEVFEFDILRITDVKGNKKWYEKVETIDENTIMVQEV